MTSETKKKGKKRPAKRPPPKGQVLVTPRGKTLIELPGPDPMEMKPGYGVSKKSRTHYLRARAGMIFMVDPSMPTVEDLCQHPDFSEIKPATMRNWAHSDQWQEKRQDFRESINAGVRKRIGNELIQQQIRILKDCDALYDQNMDYLTGNSGVEVPAPRSYESLLRAHTMFIKTISEMGREVIDVVVPPVTPQVEGVDQVQKVIPELTNEEARVAALAVVQQRRQLRSRNPSEEDEDDGDTMD
jgi:hypothetical protein